MEMKKMILIALSCLALSSAFLAGNVQPRRLAAAKPGTIQVQPGGKGYGSKVRTQNEYKSADMSKYNGVVMKQEMSKLTMGPLNDVRIFRGGMKQVVVDSDLVATGDVHVQGSFIVNGRTLRQIVNLTTVDLQKRVKELEAQVIALGGGPKPPIVIGSCADVRADKPGSQDGYYNINVEGKSVSTHCVFTSDGAAWTQAATITSQGTQWRYSDVHADKGQADGPWESFNTFGNAKNGLDFKSDVFTKFPKDQIMITFQKGSGSRQHLLTTTACTTGKTLKQTFNDLHFNAHQGLTGNGGIGWKVWVDNDHKCPLAKASKPSGEGSLANNENINWLYLKWGERNGAEDGNKDRVMLSTDARGSATNKLDYCQGLGSFAQIGSDKSVNVGIHHDGAVAGAAGHVYRVYVRQFPAKLVEGNSCSAAFSLNPQMATGWYRLKGLGSQKVYCDMSNGGGWSLAATVTSGGRAWEYKDIDGNWGHKAGPWENSNTFGSPRAMSGSRATDFKGIAYTQMSKDEIMIKYNGQHLMTTAVCHPGKSLKQTFNSLQFNAVNAAPTNCDGGWKLCVDSAHRCRVVKFDKLSGEGSLVNNKNVNWMFLKWGEREGAEDGNKDRVKISTNARGAGSNMLDYCQGLGSFAQIGKDASANVGIQHDGAVAASPGKNYEIYVRSAIVVPKVKSCNELRTASKAARKSSGYYLLGGYSPTPVYCNMNLDGGGWSLAAQISSQGKSWQYSDTDGDRGQMSSAWESTNTFGDPMVNGDYKSSVFNNMAKSELMIRFWDTRSRKLNGGTLLITKSCMPGESLLQTFNRLRFNAHQGLNCNGGWKKCVDSAHRCELASFTKQSGEVTLVNNENIKSLFWKWGERDGAEDANKDRTYLSTEARGSGSNMLDYCQGLGSFAKIGGRNTVNVGIQHDSAVTAPWGLVYELYVR